MRMIVSDLYAEDPCCENKRALQMKYITIVKLGHV